jgi:glycine cleavage system aminomethyltransferase T
VFKLEKRGHVSKRLVRLVLEGELALEPGAGVTSADGQVVGQVTSSARGDGKTWALAMVRYKHTESGTELGLAGKTAKVSCLASR